MHKILIALLLKYANCVIVRNVVFSFRGDTMARKERDMKKQTEWSRAYNEKTYDRLYPFVPKGRKAEIQAVAETQGETLNEFIVKAIEERMKRLQGESGTEEKK